MNAANRVILNTAALYVRMVITMGISFFSTRLILDALGNTDYGIFTLIGGIILMLSFLNNAMATATQRFLSFHHGQNDLKMQRKVFVNSLWLHLVLALLIVFVLEIIGLFLFKGFLNIPPERLNAARIIYHFTTGTVFFTVLGVPFNGSLVAHENLLWVAVVNVVESVLKLGVAFLLYRVVADRLVIYGLYMFMISVVSFLLYAFYCLLKYQECTMQGLRRIDKSLIKMLTSFAGWNLFGALAGLGRNQGLAVVLNLFFGTVVNAAYGVANQVSGQMQFFSTTLLRAMNPQIMKSEGAGDRDRMLRLSMMASKFAFFLMAVFAIPCMLEIHALLSLWLKQVPPETEMFCVLILLMILANQLTIGLQSAVQAQGDIKQYQLVISCLLLVNLPTAYFLLKWGFPSYTVLTVGILIELIACACRLWFVKKMMGLTYRRYWERVLGRLLLPSFFALTSGWMVSIFFNFSFRFLLTGSVSAITYLFGIYFFGLCPDEKEIVHTLVAKKLRR